MAARKKDPTARARTNRASTASTLSDGRTVIRPNLPERFDEFGNELVWNVLTIEWWDDLWASPMAGEYHSSDKHALYVLAELVDQFWTTRDPKLAAEIRQQRQAFGLTPYDRRRLEWTIETTEEAKDKGRARRNRAESPAPRKTGTRDPRLVLVQ